jgi:hypothetical protein
MQALFAFSNSGWKGFKIHSLFKKINSIKLKAKKNDSARKQIERSR